MDNEIVSLKISSAEQSVSVLQTERGQRGIRVCIGYYAAIQGGGREAGIIPSSPLEKRGYNLG